MDPGERELTDQDLRLIFGLHEITDVARAEIVAGVRPRPRRPRRRA